MAGYDAGCVLDTEVGCPRQDILIKQPLWDEPLTCGEGRGAVPASLLQTCEGFANP